MRKVLKMHSRLCVISAEEEGQRWWRWRTTRRRRAARRWRRRARNHPRTQGDPSAWAQSVPLQRARSVLLPRWEPPRLCKLPQRIVLTLPQSMLRHCHAETRLKWSQTNKQPKAQTNELPNKPLAQISEIATSAASERQPRRPWTLAGLQNQMRRAQSAPLQRARSVLLLKQQCHGQ